jgi:hypothetical protein
MLPHEHEENPGVGLVPRIFRSVRRTYSTAVTSPVSWINGKYRMVYFDCGQGDRIYSTPVLPMMIDNSLRFLLKKAK